MIFFAGSDPTEWISPTAAAHTNGHAELRTVHAVSRSVNSLCGIGTATRPFSGDLKGSGLSAALPLRAVPALR